VGSSPTRGTLRISKTALDQDIAMLKTGDAAPLDIEVLNEQEESISLKSQLGQYVVLYFYPKDDTPGCTKEACGFRDLYSELKKLGVQVIGVSKDSPATHSKFSQKYQLPFKLWSDPNHQLLEAFGAWGEKKFMGKLFMGILRSTFVIDPQGVVIQAWPKVKPEEHATEVLEFIKQKITS
jgi:thioredoxin-dependent peroxiredoxin